MSAENTKIPVYLITGFLGAGKTTFLNHFIHSLPDKRILVIENEIGKTNVDSNLIVQSAVDVMDLTAGCLCCDLNEKLYDLLYDLAQRRNEFDILVIETTGIADPAAVAETIWTGGFMDKNYELKATICIADAKNMESSIENTEEARRQITFADIVLLNKCEDIPNKSISYLQNLIDQINPDVTTMYGREGVFPVNDILDTADQNQTDKETRISHLANDFTHNHKGIQTFTLTFDRPFDYKQLKHTLMLLLHINKHQIYRIKGILDVPDMENKVILQSVYKSYRMQEGNAWPADEARKSQIVFIGFEVEKSSMERVFTQCLV